MVFVKNWQKENHKKSCLQLCGDTEDVEKAALLGSDNNLILTQIPNATCGRKLTTKRQTLKTPSPLRNMVVAASFSSRDKEAGQS